MRSSTPKVLHELGGRSLLGHVLAATAPLRAGTTVVVVGAGREAVEEHLAAIAPDAVPVLQAEQRGSGHAAAVALDAVPDVEGPVLLVNGDAPLLRAETIDRLVAEHERAGSVLTVLTAAVEDPAGLGRIVRDDSGAVRAIVEERDATDAQRAIREINAGVYVGDAAALRRSLARLGSDNDQGEQYVTDVLALLVAGVTVVDPATTWVDVTASVAPDAVLEPGTQLRGTTTVAAGAVVGPDTTLVDCQVDEGASVVRSHCLGAAIGPAATVGPFSYLRPGTRLARGAKVGAFVETKNVEIGEGSKVPHLSYVGDATIGRGANVGAATVFVNYDGVAKHHTTVGDHVRIGSDTMLVAPVTVGDGAYTAAGSVITSAAPPRALAVAPAPQRTAAGWVRRRRSGTAGAAAAEAD